MEKSVMVQIQSALISKGKLHLIKVSHVKRGRQVPKQLIDLKNWILSTKQSLHFHKTDTVIDLQSAKFFLPPTIPSPKMKKLRNK